MDNKHKPTTAIGGNSGGGGGGGVTALRKGNTSSPASPPPAPSAFAALACHLYSLLVEEWDVLLPRELIAEIVRYVQWRAVVWGGLNQNLTLEPSAECYDSLSNQWIVSSVTPTHPRRHAAFCVARGRLWLFGGSSCVGEVFDPVSDQWIVVTDKAPPIEGSVAEFIPASLGSTRGGDECDRIFLSAGHLCDEDGKTPTVVQDTWVFDIDRSEWRSAHAGTGGVPSPMPVPKDFAGAARFGESWYLFGPDPTNISNAAGLSYHIPSDQWTVIEGPKFGRICTAFVVGDRIWVTSLFATFFHCFDPVRRSWSMHPTGNPPFQNICLTSVEDGGTHIIAIGSNTYISDFVEMYSVESKKWRPLPSLNNSRRLPNVALF